MTSHTVLHKSTGSFSKLVNNYLAQEENLKSFFNYAPNLEGIAQSIEERKKYPVDRETLVDVLLEQYKDEELSESFVAQIRSLKSENTFTVCTAHQPDLMTGYLYFFYKIIHAAKLAGYLKAHFPGNNFVPVFYIGSEDNDLEELSTFNYGNRNFRWNTQQTGAVGRMKTEDLQPLISDLKKVLAPYGANRDKLIQIISEAYNGTNTIAQAIRHIVHALLGQFGVIVIDADDARLKRLYTPVMEAELLRPESLKLVTNVSERLKTNYQAQAYAREINLFYLKDAVRERIEKAGTGWKVVNTTVSWPDEKNILKELSEHPDRFSPNVILRGPYQESILPDVAFIGGGSEVAYWMQLKELFTHYKIFFPALVLRQSALWMPRQACNLQEKLQLSDEDLFLPEEELKKKYTISVSENSLDLTNELKDLEKVLDQIKNKATSVDWTLSEASKAVKAKISHLTNRLEKKMVRAKKRHLSDQMRQIEKLKSLIFPEDKLQERHDCFLELYLNYGNQFLEYQYQQTFPWGEKFLIVKDNL